MLLFVLFFLISRKPLLVYASALPPALPLFVKSPYLNYWIVDPQGPDLTKSPASFWNLKRILFPNGLIRVDGMTYEWMGGNGWSGGNATVPTVARFLTPTKSIFTIQAGPITFNVTFLSPVEPDDLALQSLPFTYIYIDGMVSTEGKPHAIQVYFDISAEFASENNANNVSWTTRQTQAIIYHTFSRQPLPPISETDEVAEDATMYLAMQSLSSTTYMSGEKNAVRGAFVNKGALPNTQDPAFRQIQDRWPVFGLALDLGVISSMDSPAVWAVEMVRDPVISITKSTGDPDLRTSYFWSRWSSIEGAMEDFLSGFGDAQARSQSLDARLQLDASRISSDYMDLVSLSLRQTFAGIDINLPGVRDSANTNTSDIRIYLKNIGFDKQTSPVQSVYSAFPAFLYLNATMPRCLLATIFEHQTISQGFVSPNLGDSYPTIPAAFNSESPARDIEDTGSMFVMSLAYTLKTGDTSLVGSHYNALNSWAGNLRSQISRVFALSDFGIPGPDRISPNVILQGITGLRCMALVNNILHRQQDPTILQDITNLTAQWISRGFKTDHVLASFDTDSAEMMYNRFPLTLLDIQDLLPQEILDKQEAFEKRQLDMQQNQLGLTLDYSGGIAGIAKNDLTMLTAASFKSDDARDGFIQPVYDLAFDPTIQVPFASTFQRDTGNSHGSASPVQGAVFALLAVNMINVLDPTTGSSIGNQSPPAQKGSSRAGIIAGSVVAGVAVVFTILALWYLYYRKLVRRRKRLEAAHPVHLPQESQGSINLQPARTDAVLSSKFRPEMRQQRHPEPSTSNPSFAKISRTNTDSTFGTP